jgi:glycosyltransferase involved in cell wall biosynthesis
MQAKTPVQVLYISYDGMTDPLGQSQVIPYLQGLSKEGFKFTLLSFEKPGRFEKFSADVAALLRQSNIDWVPLNYTKKPPVLSTIYDYIKMQRKAFALHRTKQFGIVHCRSYIAALAGLAMKRKLGVKFIFDMRGFYADERVDGGIWDLSNPVYKAVYGFFKAKEKQFLTEADYTISLTEAGKQEIHAWKNIKNQPVPIRVIPCCADLQTFSRQNVTSQMIKDLRRKLGINEDDFILSYLGSIGTWYMLDEMLDFFRCLLRTKPHARFLFITTDDAAAIVSKALDKGIEQRALLVTSAARSQVPAYLLLSNCSIFFIKPVFSKIASSPTKQAEIEGMDIPYVCNSGVGDVAEIVNQTERGYCVHNFDNESYLKAIDDILAKSNHPLPGNRTLLDNLFSTAKGISNYLGVYQYCSNKKIR